MEFNFKTFSDHFKSKFQSRFLQISSQQNCSGPRLFSTKLSGSRIVFQSTKLFQTFFAKGSPNHSFILCCFLPKLSGSKTFQNSFRNFFAKQIFDFFVLLPIPELFRPQDFCDQNLDHLKVPKFQAPFGEKFSALGASCFGIFTQKSNFKSNFYIFCYVT